MLNYKVKNFIFLHILKLFLENRMLKYTCYAYAEEFGNFLQGIDIGVASAGFPFGDSGSGNKQCLRQFFLSQPFLLAQML